MTQPRSLLCGKGTFLKRCSLCLLFPCQSGQDQIFMFPCWTPNPSSPVSFLCPSLWRQLSCCTPALTIFPSLFFSPFSTPSLLLDLSSFCAALSAFSPLSCSPWLITARAMFKLKVGLALEAINFRVLFCLWSSGCVWCLLGVYCFATLRNMFWQSVHLKIIICFARTMQKTMVPRRWTLMDLVNL